MLEDFNRISETIGILKRSLPQEGWKPSHRTNQETEVRREFDFGNSDTYHHGKQLLAFNPREFKKMSKIKLVTRAESRRTGLPRLLGARYFDGLFCIVNVFWPVVIERSELHG